MALAWALLGCAFWAMVFYLAWKAQSWIGHAVKAVGGQTRIVRLVVLVVVSAAVTYWSVEEGRPKALPGAALGWPALFYVERAAALLGSAGVVLLVGWRALHGHFPIKFGNIEYETPQVIGRRSESAAEGLDRRLRFVEVLTGVRDVTDVTDENP